MARLAQLMGRGRALEAVLAADDFPGRLAERYGYVNRSLPDGELDVFVDGLARRIAGFDKAAITEAKRLVDAASLPADAAFPPALERFFESVARPETKARTRRLLEHGLQVRSELELNLGRHVAGG